MTIQLSIDAGVYRPGISICFERDQKKISDKNSMILKRTESIDDSHMFEQIRYHWDSVNSSDRYGDVP